MTANYRWRQIMEIRYREERKKYHYFNRKSYKKMYRLWVRAKRLELTELSYNDFVHSIVGPESVGVRFIEMEMNIGRLEQHLKGLQKAVKEVAESELYQIGHVD